MEVMTRRVRFVNGRSSWFTGVRKDDGPPDHETNRCYGWTRLILETTVNFQHICIIHSSKACGSSVPSNSKGYLPSPQGPPTFHHTRRPSLLGNTRALPSV